MKGINISNKLFYSLLACFVMMLFSIGAWAYNTNNPQELGHSSGEINVLDGNGNPISLQDYLDNLENQLDVRSNEVSNEINTLQIQLQNTNDRFRESFSFIVGDRDLNVYGCVEQDLEEWCGDGDGCTIRLLMQHLNAGDDPVRVIYEYIYMEQSDISNNNAPNDIYGHTKQAGGGDFYWRTGPGTNRYHMFNPWSWMWMHNYRHDWCPNQAGNGPVYENPYYFNFLAHNHIIANVTIYD